MNDKLSGTLDKSSTEVANLKCQLNLNDVWRYYNPDIKEYSYMDPSGRGRNSRIDLLLGSGSLTVHTDSCAIKQSPGWDGDIMHSFSTSPHSKGVSILIAKGLPYNVISTHCGRLILINLELNGVEYSICNVYCPNDLSDRLKFLGALKLFINTHAVSKKHILVGGDFNCVDSMDDKSSGTLDKSSTELGNLKCQLNLNDIWRYYNPDIKEYSYMDPSGRGRNSRIDLLLGSESLTVHTDSCAIKQAPGTRP